MEVDTELLRLVEGNELMRLAKGKCMPMVRVMLIGHDSLEASVVAQEFHLQFSYSPIFMHKFQDFCYSQDCWKY